MLAWRTWQRDVEEDGGALSGTALPAIDFGDADERNLHRHAAQHAQDAIDAARKRAQAFDEDRKRENEAATRRREEQRMVDGDVDAEGDEEEEQGVCSTQEEAGGGAQERRG